MAPATQNRPSKRRSLRRWLGLTLTAGAATIAAVAATGCGPQLTPGFVLGCSPNMECQKVPPDYEAFTCPDNLPYVVFALTNPRNTVESQRLEADRMQGIMRHLSGPGSLIIINGPTNPGNTVSTIARLQVESARQVFVQEVPKGEGLNDRTRRAELERDVDGRDGCRHAREQVMRAAAPAIDQSAGLLASGTATGFVDGPVPLELELAQAQQVFQSTPELPHKGIISAAPLDTPLPAPSLYPDLAGSDWVWIYTPSANQGADRAARDQITGLFTAMRARVVFVQAGFASPAELHRQLHPGVDAPGVSSTSPHKETDPS